MKYLRCQVCGFVGKEGKIKKVCPACGAPISAFETYHYKINEERLKILNLHIHPILVHFPQSLAFLSVVFIAIALIMQGAIGIKFFTIEKILSILLPMSVLMAIFAGALDAKTRFKNRWGPYIIQKIAISIIFLLSSIATAVFVHLATITVLDKAFMIALSIVSFSCSGLLGKKGGTLLDSQLADK